jgi:two-component system, LuxR family, sensor kinase FixL
MPSRDSDALHTLGLTAARWQAILNTAQDAIICISATGEITLFNACAERMFGYAAEEVLGQNVRLLMPPPYRDEHDGYLSSYRATGVPQAIGRVRQVRAQRKNGEVFPIELSVSEAVVGDETFFNAIIRDVSERDQAQAERARLNTQLHQHERLADIGAMTARIVHDFGNPLAGLSMTAQQVLRRIDRSPTSPAEALRVPVERLIATTGHLDALLHDFKDFAREYRLSLEPVALAPFLEDVVRLWQPEAESRSVILTLEAALDLAVHLDRHQCRRVFDNLLKNALEAIDRGPGQVHVHATVLTPETVRVSVLDSGPGVPEGLDVFALFETTKPHGTGLGLPICKQILMAHGGGLHFARMTPRGAVFHVDLLIKGPRLPVEQE